MELAESGQCKAEDAMMRAGFSAGRPSVPSPSLRPSVPRIESDLDIGFSLASLPSPARPV